MSENKTNNKPVFKVKAGTIDGAVWEQTGEKGNFLTVSVYRNYKDKDGNWQTTNSLKVNDLPAMQLVLGKCFEYAKIKGGDNSEE